MQLLDLERYVSLERCRLVKYDDYSETLDQSFEDQEVGVEGGGEGGEGGGKGEWKEEGGMSIGCDIVLLPCRMFH